SALIKERKSTRKEMKKPGVRRASSFGLQGMKTAGGTGSPPTRRACWRTSAQGEGAAIRFVAEGRGSPGEPKAGARGTASD
ncbi:hypothetical protein, partial [Pseudomonas aeruginosa]|uniref:hypothetical protein n=1 Tax=Pseudomonas aeruginosa TaxID=287 RepID=UPI001C8AF3E5